MTISALENTDSENKFNIHAADKSIMPHKNNFSWMGYSDMAMGILEEWWKQLWEWKNESATELDLFSIRWKNREEIIDLIKEKIQIDIRTKEGIEEMNIAFQDAVRFYNDVLYRKVGNIWKTIFKSSAEIVDFIKQTETWWTKSQIYCNLVKLTFNNHRASSDLELQDLDEKAKWLIVHKLNPIIQLKKPWFPFENEKEKAVITTTLANGEEKKIEFFIKFRWKTADSTKLKLLYNPEYTTTEAIMDGIWLQVEAKNPDSLIIVLNYLYDNFFDENITTLKAKNIYEGSNKEETHGDILHPNFLDKFIKMDQKMKPGSKQRTITMTWFKRVPRKPELEWSQQVPQSTEIQWVLTWNRNNSWLSNHRIYDQAKKISAMIRLQWYVTENYLKLIINKMYEENHDLDFNKEKVLQHYKDSLITIYFDEDKKKKPYYTTKNRYMVLKSWKWLYPQGISSQEWDAAIEKKKKEDEQKRQEARNKSEEE